MNGSGLTRFRHPRVSKYARRKCCDTGTVLSVGPGLCKQVGACLIRMIDTPRTITPPRGVCYMSSPKEDVMCPLSQPNSYPLSDPLPEKIPKSENSDVPSKRRPHE